ncbi:DUF47 domain-containing protein [[Archangium] primigenium]|uniref:DUF47 domain-containing protein n=1 Tax=Melittangium TaxID=44 RepID=UPI00195A1E69|nr:DUF47 family protein [Archangium primigenium]MBM7117354.1 DUF47 family protein [Archangium primigenium]
MFEKLMPRTDGVFNAFDAQCAITLEGVRILHELMSDYRDVPARVEALSRVGAEGDSAANVAIERLHAAFITPFDRTHIHSLLSRIDEVLDFSRAAAARLQFHELPERLPEAAELTGLLLLTTDKVREVVGTLRRIQQPEPILAGCKAIKQLVSKADETLAAGMGRLFKSGMDHLTVLKWREVYELIETATDKCRDAANVVEGVVLAYA